MPSTNHFKFGASGISSATRGGFSVGVNEGADYGPTSTTGFWNGVTPPVGGYVIYVDKASQGPSIHVAYDNTECIKMLLHMGATGSTIENVLAWANGQSNMAVLTAELTIGDLPAGPTTYLALRLSAETGDPFPSAFPSTGQACAGWTNPAYSFYSVYAAESTIGSITYLYADSGLTTPVVNTSPSQAFNSIAVVNGISYTTPYSLKIIGGVGQVSSLAACP